MDVTIRPYAMSDVDALVAAARESTREVFPWLPWCHPQFSAAEASEWVDRQVEAWARRSAFEFCIVDRNGGFLGGCGINQIHAGHRFANVGYWVRTSASRRGVASAALARIVDFAWAETDLRRLEIVVAVGNEPSARVAERSGATFEGVLAARLCLHGVMHDARMYAIVLARREGE